MVHRLYLYRTGELDDSPVISFHSNAADAFKHFTRSFQFFEYKEAKCWEVLDGEFIARWSYKRH